MSTLPAPAETASSSPDPSFERARARFPAARSVTYLDLASRSLIPASALEIATRHLRERMEGRVEKSRYFDLVESARSRFAQMIGARLSEIAMTKNVSEGLNIIAASIDWRDGDEVVLCSAIEHPNNVYAWRNLERQGVRVRDLPSANGLFPLEAALETLKQSRPPRVMTVSGTSFKPGFRTDLDTLGAACRRAGTLLVVDGAQSAGLTHLDVSSTQIDALAVSTQKGLCALYGMGFLYVRKEVAETLSPRYLARFSVDMEAAHEADYDSAPIKYREAALRFDVGNYNFLAAALVDDTLELLGSYGTRAIDAHITGLAVALAQGLGRLGAPVIAPAGAGWTNIVCVELPGGGEKSAPGLQDYLKQQGIHAAVRGNVVRFSMHLYNNMPDIEHALEATGQWLRHQGLRS